MKRIQFYPDNALLQSLNSDATKLGVAVSTLVKDILLRHYGLVPNSSDSELQLTANVLDEVKEFIATRKPDDEPFDLLSASVTFAQIEMTYAGKPSVIRAKIGKTFAKNIGSGDFTQVAVNIVNGKVVKSTNNATTYIISQKRK